MPLIVDDGADRAQQMLLLTERLNALVGADLERMARREPPGDGAEADERQRLADAYRREMARIAQNPTMLAGAPRPLVEKLKVATAQFNAQMAKYAEGLSVLKSLSEGLVAAIAEEAQRAAAPVRVYDRGGGYGGAAVNRPLIVNRSA